MGRRWRPRGDDRGTSLAELVVVMGLMGLVGTLVVSVSVQVLRSVRVVEERRSDVDDARVALQAMSRTLRAAVDPDGDGPLQAFLDVSAVAPLQSGPQQVAFFSAYHQRVDRDVDGDPTTASAPARYRYWIQQEPHPVTGAQQWVLREQVWPWPGTRDAEGRPTYPAVDDTSSPPRERVLARDLDTSGTESAFTYSRAARDATGRATGVTDVATPPLQPADAADVRAVSLWIKPARTAGGGTRPVTVATRVIVENNPEVVK